MSDDRYCIADGLIRRGKSKSMYKNSDVSAEELRRIGFEVIGEDLTEAEAIALLKLINGSNHD